MFSGGTLITSPGFSNLDYASQDTPEKLPALGDKAYFDGVEHTFVQVHTACVNDVIAANEVLYRTATSWVVTNDTSEGLSNSVNNYCGIAPQLTASVPESTSALKYYMWMATYGDQVKVKTNGDDDISAGDLIIAAQDGTCNSAASPGPAEYIGVAAAADVDASNTVLVNLRPV